MTGHRPAGEVALRRHIALVEQKLAAVEQENRLLRAQHEVLTLVVRYLTSTPGVSGTDAAVIAAVTAEPPVPTASGPGP